MKMFRILLMTGLVGCLFHLSGCFDAVNKVPPFIQSITPTSGTAMTQVKITGTDFAPEAAANQVKFNGVGAIVISSNTFDLVVLVPENAGTGKVTVTTAGGTAEGPEFRYLNPFTIESVEPLLGATGTEVTITGQNFDPLPGGTVVRFNGTVANIKSLTATKVVAIVPVGAGSGKITVRTAAGLVTGPNFDYIYSATVTTFAGDGTAGFGNGSALEARFNLPTGLVFDASDNLYVCDRDNNLIRKIAADGNVSTLAGSGVAGSIDGNGIGAALFRPNQIFLTAEGNLLVTEAGSGNIRKITPSADVTTLAGTGSNGYADGTGTTAIFNTPAGMAANALGNIFVCDAGNYRIRQISPENEVTTLAGSGNALLFDGAGALASFVGPFSVLIDAVGNLVVTDVNSIRKVTLEGEVTTMTGNNDSGMADGTLEAARFNSLRGIAKWRNDFFVVADGGNHAIRLITASGNVVTIAGNGTSGLVNGTGPESRFNTPYAIAVNSKNEIFVADRLNSVIRKIVLK